MRLWRKRSEHRSRPADPYFMAAAQEARRLGSPYVGTEHLLAALIADAGGDTAMVLQRLGADRRRLEDAILQAAQPGTAHPDAKALAALGIDLDTVRARLDAAFGPGALERTTAGCLAICPRTKRALEAAVKRAGSRDMTDADVLLGVLSISDCAAARILGQFGVSLESAASLMG